MDPQLLAMVREFIGFNPDAKTAFDSIIARGKTQDYAEAEIARVFTATLWEVWNGRQGNTDRLFEALRGLARGRTAEELFPDEVDFDEDRKLQ